ncbi:hypothetical protein EIP86_005284 [Pleurotus ostreatoroseus]|nr:hypothetical protein EIP86_005284 [Pleurotus ostreatoroseus]
MSDKHKLAQSPFDSDDADFILQTKDRVVFRVFKAILAQASPVLANTLSVPHPPVDAAQEEDYIDGIPVLRLEEESQIIDLFLRICYPIVNPVLELSDLYDMYKTGHKYDTSIVIHEARERLSIFALQEATCLRAYAIACRLELQRTKFEELDLISGSTFVNLLDYHRHYQGVVANRLLHPNYWMETLSHDDEPFFVSEWYGSSCCELDDDDFFGTWKGLTDDGDPMSQDTPYHAKCWMAEFLTELRQNVRAGQSPVNSVIADTQVFDRAVEKARKCEQCAKTVFRSLTFYVQEIAGQAAREAEFVSL